MSPAEGRAPEAVSSGYQPPETPERARDLVEDLAIDRYYQPADLQPLLAGLDAAGQDAVKALADELRNNPFITDSVLDFYGRKLWGLLYSSS